MTLAEISTSEKVVLVVKDIAPVIGLSPEKIRDQAMKDPSRLGFPIIVADKSIRIPRVAFLKFMNGSSDKEAGKASGE